MGPMGFASSITGLPTGKKKKTHRGRKASGKPGSDHLAALQKAHGAGDFKAAKIHALNYAKSAHKHGADDEEEAMEMVQPGPPPSVTDLPSAKAPQPPPDRRAMLAKLAMGRKK